MNDLTLFFVAIPIFFLAYQGIGLLLENQAEHKWSSAPGLGHSFSSQKLLQKFSNFSGKLGFNRVLLRNGYLARTLELLLLRSGNPFGWNPEDLLLCKELLAVFMVILYTVSGVDQPVIWLLGLILGFWLPDLYLKAKISARQTTIHRQLPGFVDLTALTLESGLDFLAAIERILEKIKPSPLREELHILLQETRLGTPRKEALAHLAHRVNLPDVQSVTSIIIQSEELGTSLASVLRSYSEDMRSKRILRAEEIAGKAPVKLLFPMAVFFFPIVMVIILGPIALSFLSGYK